MSAPTINTKELDKDTHKALGVSEPRENAFSVEEVASAALKCLAAIAGLTRQQRERVLRHAAKLNKIRVRGD
jgi:hypothetical protein